jgi:hypothetical protein
MGSSGDDIIAAELLERVARSRAESYRKQADGAANAEDRAYYLQLASLQETLGDSQLHLIEALKNGRPDTMEAVGDVKMPTYVFFFRRNGEIISALGHTGVSDERAVQILQELSGFLTDADLAQVWRDGSLIYTHRPARSESASQNFLRRNSQRFH